MPNFVSLTQKNFHAVAEHLFSQLQQTEVLNVNLSAERTIFVRFNDSKVRQNTLVEQRTLSLILQSGGKSVNVSFSITGDPSMDMPKADQVLNHARQEALQLPTDPNLVPLVNSGISENFFSGTLLNDDEVAAAIAVPAAGCDFAGLYCAGPIISANRNSLGQSHWFSTESFFVDYSVYNQDKAAKGAYAGSVWNQKDFEKSLAQTKSQLALMERPKKVLQPGAYRTYLAPAAVAEIATMFSWGALSYGTFKQDMCPFDKLGKGEKSLSPLFSMRENFEMGLTTRFNELGELAPKTLELITEGRLKNFLTSSRTAKEYGSTSNAASSFESPRSLEILPGALQEADILKELGTGLYLSNLHYINWSDRPTARITGMTRYACFWVENGEIVAPIADMRFDESLYDCLGENLLGVTAFQNIDPELSTYEARALGGKKLPGMLIRDFKFTL